MIEFNLYEFKGVDILNEKGELQHIGIRKYVSRDRGMVSRNS